MKLDRRLSRPGLVVSALVHAGALAAVLVSFSQTEKFDEQQELAPPVAVITENEFNQIMKGDTAAKEVRPEAVPQAEKVASLPDPTTTPPTPEQRPSQPPPPPPPPPPRQVEQPPPTPPVRPRPVAAPPPPPTPPVRDVAEEPDLPKPIPKPVVKPPPVPLPPVVPHPVVAKVTPPTPPKPKPKPVEKKPDQLAKLMDEQQTQDSQTPAPPTPKPSVSHVKPTRAPSQESRFDPTDISKLLSHDAPAQHPASNRDLSHMASLGSPTASAPKMSPSFWAGLDGLLEDQYRGCWSYLGLSVGTKYVPQVRVMYGQDGSLLGQPVLLNPPSDPGMQSLADSALRAVRRCNPLKIPEQYAPYYEQWRGRVLRFDPEEMAG